MTLVTRWRTVTTLTAGVLSSDSLADVNNDDDTKNGADNTDTDTDNESGDAGVTVTIISTFSGLLVTISVRYEEVSSLLLLIIDLRNVLPHSQRRLSLDNCTFSIIIIISRVIITIVISSIIITDWCSYCSVDN